LGISRVSRSGKETRNWRGKRWRQASRKGTPSTPGLDPGTLASPRAPRSELRGVRAIRNHSIPRPRDGRPAVLPSERDVVVRYSHLHGRRVAGLILARSGAGFPSPVQHLHVQRDHLRRPALVPVPIVPFPSLESPLDVDQLSLSQMLAEPRPACPTPRRCAIRFAPVGPEKSVATKPVPPGSRGRARLLPGASMRRVLRKRAGKTLRFGAGRGCEFTTLRGPSFHL
jgi:hypothetical protein